MSAPNPGLFEQTLYSISDPAHPRYAQYLKRDELKAMLRPNDKATEAVLAWLVKSGVDRSAIAQDGEWINFVCTVGAANDLLDTSFGVFEDVDGQKLLRTLNYSVPDKVCDYIDMVQPTTRFSVMQPMRSTIYQAEQVGDDRPYTPPADPKDIKSVCDGKHVTPDCLRALYKIPNDPQIDNATSGYMAFANFLEQHPRFDDLSKFTEDYFPRANGVRFTWDTINGAPPLETVQTSNISSSEANLDLQYILATGWPLNIHSYNVGGLGKLVPDLDQPSQAVNQNEPYLDWLNYVLSQNDQELPHTVSVSYGENEQSIPEPYRRKVCDLFGQLGARGVSVLVASGDSGVGSACQTNDGKNTTRFMPLFPASCPYVTAVGGTWKIDPEEAIDFSSGGFSDTWPAPDYQKDAVAKYLQFIGDDWKGLYEPRGRGYPDVAAQAYQYKVFDQGNETNISGASASAPAFAGIIALLNAKRLQAGKSTLGFLNPWIYGQAFQALTDIVKGGSSGCTGIDKVTGLDTPFVEGASWKAVEGWDAVTGWGTPDYEKLLELAMAL
ncbi:hypothetical protein CKM354_000537200 [Cercospora kikuchii]|uniref:tripeptidyl-peptidase II n=1 Tax=Cercospora kikuchii TaxID=84275 RepID=A0A9P3FFH6_9PEZI|nr:uncharacterized protein CKM354_000537200 [Cercospora kikuchii]GIZ42092.1 hypothetical protein CKM354_000537200 [Cercospora kikuchii]